MRTNEYIFYLFQKAKHNSQHSGKNSKSEIYAITFKILVICYCYIYLYASSVLGTIPSSRVKKKKKKRGVPAVMQQAKDPMWSLQKLWLLLRYVLDFWPGTVG